MFEMHLPGASHPQLALLVTHDCDICADDALEPDVEFIEASIDQRKEGNLTLGKNPRTLQVEAKDCTEEIVLQVAIQNRRRMNKQEFFSNVTKARHQLALREVAVLRRWLAARYTRSAFPNSFQELLDKTKVAEKLDALAKRHGSQIRGVFFDLDNNQLIELSAEKRLHELHIYVVYLQDSSDDDAERYAKSVEKLFKDAFFDAEEEWTGIRLLSCEPYSEDAFSYALALSSKSWLSDHRSFAGYPAASHFPDVGG
ncbi:hypothetical protein [Dyella sp. S184]|uniref:hypothetical protein n=1 Tax=Dyella sp. S184 TaxID=1641862 RepID=UPI00131E5E54|nr:hypothetical protein [Dyella sp. S184]